jgi:hypothetical protein
MTYEQWMTDTERRIIESKSHAQSSGCFDLIVWQAMMLLHMPCARNQEPTADSVYKCFDAAVQLASKHWDIAQSDYVDQPWHAAHNCYEAGMLILYHLWYFPTIADQYTTGQVFDVVHKLSGFFVSLQYFRLPHGLQLIYRRS